MLIQRLITSLLLLPLLMAAIFLLPSSALYAVFCGAGLLAGWEWAGLMPGANPRVRAAFVLAAGLAMLLAWTLRAHALWFCAAAALWWLYALWLLRGYPQNFERARPGPLAMSLIGLLLLVPTMLALWQLHAMPDGGLRLLFLFFLVFAADTGAYLAGRSLGRRKLAPSISPGKTLEGMLGGLALCAAWAICAGPLVFRLASFGEIVQVTALALLIAAFTVVGDLIESLFKRVAGVKDSGRLLPGHGGVLDRVDSILAGAPLLALGLMLLGL